MLSPEKPGAAVDEYFNELLNKFRTGQAGEHAYRPAFEKLIKGIDPKINPMNDPKRSEHGAPDFVFIRGDVTAGYAETKDIGVDLNKEEKTNQMKRYFGYSNLILTDYLEFRFFRNGERYGEPIIIGETVGNGLAAKPQSFSLLKDALQDFLRGQAEPIRSGAQLAKIMGGKARRIRDNVRIYLTTDSEKNAELLGIFETVKRLLVHDLSTEKFADMYAQTLVYGLFVARYNDDTQDGFSRQKARDLVPASNPFLREFFDHIVGPRFDVRLRFIVDELCAVFSVSDLHEIVHRHLKVDGDGHDEKDPIIHFYEDFLQEYDPAERKKMGAYYTPIPVARFIVRAVDEALKRDFELARVYHADLFGKRAEKFKKLEDGQPKWQELTLDEEMYYFVGKSIKGKAEYENGIQLSDLFQVYNTGIVTMGDSFIVSENPATLESRIEKLQAGLYDEGVLNQEFSLGKNYAKWVLSNRAKISFDKNKIVPLAYRPFDTRFTYFDNKLVWRHRDKVMQHFLKGKNFGLIFKRGGIEEKSAPTFIVDGISESRSWSRPGMQGVEFNAPLFLYHDDGSRTPNFDREVIKIFTHDLHKPYEPEDIIDYIYAVLHSPKYREKYKEFLKIDFPRVPAPADDAQFHRLAAFGKRLRELHLLTSPTVNNFITTYPKDGSNIVEAVSYKDGKVWINKEQYFGNVPEVAWNFYIGGYQPAQKWLKDRKGRVLTNDDIEHYQKIIVALTETERKMREIDRV